MDTCANLPPLFHLVAIKVSIPDMERRLPSDLAEALTSGQDWSPVAEFDESMAARAEVAAEGAAQELNGVFCSEGAAPVLEHYHQRTMDYPWHLRRRTASLVEERPSAQRRDTNRAAEQPRKADHVPSFRSPCGGGLPSAIGSQHITMRLITRRSRSDARRMGWSAVKARNSCRLLVV